MSFKTWFDLRITPTNIIAICGSVFAVLWFTAVLSGKVDSISAKVDALANVSDRVMSLESSAVAGKAAREKLELRVDGLEGGLTDIKVSLGRIEERIIALANKQ